MASVRTVLMFQGKDSVVDLDKKYDHWLAKDLTLEAWVYVSADQKLAGIISRVFDSKDKQSGYGLLLSGNHGVLFSLKTATSGLYSLDSGPNTLPLNEWHHIAATYDGSQMVLYIDGEKKASHPLVASSLDYDPDNNLRIGMYKDDDEQYSFSGKLADIRLWKVARSQDAIRRDMRLFLTGQETGLVGFWPLHEGEDIIAYDQSPSICHGVLRGATWEPSVVPFGVPPTGAGSTQQEPTAQSNEHLTKIYGERKYLHTTMARHNGTVVAFAMDDQRRIFYAVLALDESDPSKGSLDVNAWPEEPRLLAFSNEIGEIGFAVAGSTRMPTVKLGSRVESKNPDELDDDEIDPFLSTTARLTALAPFQVFSDGKHLFLFRQSISAQHADAVFKRKDGGCSGDASRTDFVLAAGERVPIASATLLCDRFVLAGGALKTSMEVRFRRSRHKTMPSGDKDTLGTEDMNGKTFYEPTQELSSVRNLSEGRFAVVLLPTQIRDLQRWQFFAFNPKTDRIDCLNVEQADDGLFNLAGSQLYTSPDPKYRDAVLERTPGKCPFTGADLVPLLVPSDYAETALQLDGKDDFVEITSGSAALGFPAKSYTIEAWIKPTALGRAMGLVSKMSAPQTGGYQLGILADGRLRHSHGVSASELTSSRALRAGDYQHVAVTYDGTVVRFFIDGEPAGSAEAAYSPDAATSLLLGSSRGSSLPLDAFAGTLDEVRIWDRARREDELGRDKSYRLVGNEPGLVAYYRFDEGDGRRLYDQTDSALHGEIHGGACWVTSDAPIGDRPAIRRDSFHLLGRTVEKGPSATLYYQQEDATTGYGGDPKPMKRQARVMLACSTSGPGPDGAVTDKQHIAVIDVSIGRDGKLAQVPDELALPMLVVPMAGATKEQIQTAEAEYKAAKERADVASAELLSKPGVPSVMAAHNAAQKAYKDTQARLSALTKGQLGEEFTLPMPTLHVDRLGLPVSGALLGFAWSDAAPQLFDSVMGQVCLYFRGQERGQFYAAYYCPSVARDVLHLGSDDHGLVLFAASAGVDLGDAQIVISDGPTASTCTLTVKLPGATETWKGVPRAARRLAEVLCGQAASSQFFGTVAAMSGTTLTLQKAGAKALPAGSVLRIGSEVVKTAASVGRNATVIPLLAAPTKAQTPGQSVHFLSYDYDQATSSRPGVRLDGGSLSFRPVPTLDETPLQNGEARRIKSAEFPHWHGDAPGRALYFDGKSTCLTFAGTDLSPLVSDRDLTMEAWIRPEVFDGDTARVLSCITPLAEDAALTNKAFGAFAFDGNGGFDCGSELTLRRGAFTIELWVRRTNRSRNDEALLSLDNDCVKVHWYGNRFACSDLSRNSFSVLDSGWSPDALWHHFAITQCLETFETILYRDGNEVCRQRASVLYDTKGPLLLGMFRPRPVVNSASEMDEIRIWNQVRSQSDIKRMMQQRATGKEPGLLRCFSFADQVAFDRSPTASHGNPERITWNVVQSPLPPFVPSLAEERYMLGLQKANGQTAFTFQDDWSIGITNGVRLVNTDFTIECWVSRSRWSVSRNEAILNYGNQNGNVDIDRIELGFNPNDTFGFLLTGSNLPPLATPGTYRDKAWHHFACTYDIQTHQHVIYCDGVEVARMTQQRNSNNFACKGVATIGAYASNYILSQLRIDEVRVWSRKRSLREIRADMYTALSGREPGLVGLWGCSDGKSIDRSPNGNHGTMVNSRGNTGPMIRSESPVHPGYRVVVGVNGEHVRSLDTRWFGSWSHVAFAFQQQWGVRLQGAAYLEVGNDDSLNISDDLTIEASLQLGQTGILQPIVCKGGFSDGKGKSVPYGFFVFEDGRLGFSFESASGSKKTFASSAKIASGSFCRVAVMRKGGTDSQETKAQRKVGDQTFDVVEKVQVNKWDEISFYINGSPAGSGRYYDDRAAGHDGPLLIGKWSEGSRTSTMQGALSEVRLWRGARDVAQIGKPIGDSDNNLVARWRFPENHGTTTQDDGERYPARLRGGVKWIKTPDPQGSPAWLYLDGRGVPFERLTTSEAAGLAGSAPGFSVGALVQGSAAAPQPAALFHGDIEEVRVWKTARAEEQILDNLFTRLKGEQADLIAYYSFDGDSTSPDSTEVRDNGLRANHLKICTSDLRSAIVRSSAPISNDTAQVRSALAGIKTAFHDRVTATPAVAEYGDVQRIPGGGMRGAMKRCYSYLKDGTWHLITGYKVGNLVTEWVGQAQFAPQIMGYIEGAPPVPSENFTVGAIVPGNEFPGDRSKVEFVQADRVSTVVGSSSETTMTGSFSAELKTQAKADTLLITAPLGIGVAKPLVEGGVHAGFKFETELSGGWSSEHTIGSTISTSRNLAVTMGGFWEDPQHPQAASMGRRYVPDNLGFALVQSDTADVYAMRLEHNRVLVGYRMVPNPDIPRDWNIIPFPLNPRYTKQGTLDGCIGFNESGKICDVDYPMAKDYGEYSYFKPREAYSIKRRILREQQQELAYYGQFSTASLTPGAISSVSDKASAMLSDYVGDLPAEAASGPNPKASQSFAKRNLCNTYVWTAGGGFFEESTETADTVTESQSGNFSYNIKGTLNVGFDFTVFGFGLAAEIDASFGGGQSRTRTKSREAERAFSLSVTCNTPGDLQQYEFDSDKQIFDSKGNPVTVPGKVDAYRFLSFYLEPDRSHFQDFYRKVVDPIWIEQSDSPNASALRQARQDSKEPPCWRVLHRVTFVSRVLPPIPPPSAPPLEQAMHLEDIQSNYELIQCLEPYVKPHLGSQSALAAATRDALQDHLPELVPHADQVIQYLIGYYGVSEHS